MPTVLEALAKIVFMLVLVLGLVPPLIWVERKASAFIQDRTGPNRAQILGIRLAGLVHPIADVFKLLFKEDVRPDARHKALYNLAPLLSMTVALSTFAVIPFGDFIEVAGRRIPLIVADLNVGVLYILAVASLGTYGIILGGWSSNSKYSFLGALRASAQMISYEISMGLALMGLILVFSSLRISDMVAGQGALLWGFLPKWGVVVQPLGFLLFLVSVFAETNRNPFDIPDGESEIVAGYHLEFSSMKFALFFMAEYANMVIAAAVISALYFGGYQIPWLPRSVLVEHAGILLPIKLVIVALVSIWIAALYFRRAQREKGKFGDARDREPSLLGGLFALLALVAVISFALKPWAVGPGGASLFATLVQIGAFVFKIMFFAYLFVWVRWTLPRFRYDQLMKLGWKYLLPLALANLVATAVVLAVV